MPTLVNRKKVTLPRILLTSMWISAIEEPAASTALFLGLRQVPRDCVRGGQKWPDGRIGYSLETVSKGSLKEHIMYLDFPVILHFSQSLQLSVSINLSLFSALYQSCSSISIPATGLWLARHEMPLTFKRCLKYILAQKGRH